MLRVLELFAGIGAASKALENLGIEHEIVDAVEIDKYAIKAFNAIHGTNFEPQDITKWDKDIEIDLLIHGSPCQDYSIAGLQAGGDKGSGTRSSLMYESVRIIEKLRPKYVIWENVKNLLSKKHRHNFDAYLETMERLGYKNYYQVLDAKNYGVPQHRERVFAVSVLGGSDFNFPEPIPLEKKLKDVLEKDVDKRYYLSKEQVDGLLDSNYDQNKRFYDINGVSPTLSTMGGGQRQPKIVEDFYKSRPIREYRNIGPTLRSERTGLKVADGTIIRKLTPKECYRLMGFDDGSFERASKVISSTQLYKTAGNSIVVDVLMAIFKELLKDGKTYSE